MKFRNIEAFLAVAESLSFSKAGERLGLSQSAVTLQIKELEKEMGVLLFDRLNKNVRLTAAGETFAEYAQQVLADTDAVLQQFHGMDEIEGSLHIAVWQTVNMFIIPELLKEYHRRYPKVTVTLTEPSPFDFYERIAANAYDLAIMVDDPVIREDMISLRGKREELCFVVSPEHPLAQCDECTLKDLAEYDFLLTTRNHTYYKKLLEHLTVQDLSLRVFIECGDTEPLKRMAQLGIGVAFLPRFCVEEGLQNGTLKCLSVKDFSAAVYCQAIYHKHKWISPAMRALLDLMNELKLLN